MALTDVSDTAVGGAELGRGRTCFHQRLWRAAFAELSAADRHGGGLGVEDVERLAISAYMAGRDDECEAAWMRAHRLRLLRGEREEAARCAFGQSLQLFFRGDLALAMGWVARGGRALDGISDCVELAWLRMLTALPRLFEGDAEAGYSAFVEAAEIAERFGDADAMMFARLGRGYGLILKGRLAEGMALLDEVMIAVITDEVSPVLAGIAYCQVIVLCHGVFDLRRASEWTAALSRWCDSQPDVGTLSRQLPRASERDLPAPGCVARRSRRGASSNRVACRAARLGFAGVRLLPIG